MAASEANFRHFRRQISQCLEGRKEVKTRSVSKLYIQGLQESECVKLLSLKIYLCYGILVDTFV